MPNEISGLPAHILLVHVVIVLVPVAAALVIVASLWPAARRWLNWLPALAALGALIAVPITTSAGHWLKNHLRVPVSPAIQHHVNLGQQMLPWVAALFAASLLLWGLALCEGVRTLAVGRTARDARSTTLIGRRRLSGPAVKVLIAVIAIVAAVGAIQQVYRTGEAGSRAVWSGTFNS